VAEEPALWRDPAEPSRARQAQRPCC
jgi:hypothetical protein